ncbi:hypothetical protein BU24DRAFT_77481 [Aaosphaeria arxii CBS 175.79]|uniref:Uncharacterized protein n=1 Tax=Aaosphaeria arxii CBS 175.79 TaxID=1450172 RepID=A0A6A5X9E8_9PLEO|nr:uncharacterized protein BU24DRAFT_77481 [Aaosphaeria arxii CBS 175.79]KAF2009529.1 hypothetical protein BU24DRAFT_77481 [Aaosphaeria arxii CBS 175.79]
MAKRSSCETCRNENARRYRFLYPRLEDVRLQRGGGRTAPRGHPTNWFLPLSGVCAVQLQLQISLFQIIAFASKKKGHVRPTGLLSPSHTHTQ